MGQGVARYMYRNKGACKQGIGVCAGEAWILKVISHVSGSTGTYSCIVVNF